MSNLNYRHLHYFWVVAKEGGIARAAERLGMAVQTVSAQVRELERSLGHQLLKPQGRGVALTEAGRVAFERAEEIFQIGQAITRDVRQVASSETVRLTVGMSDGLSKLAAHALLEPVLHTSGLKLVCHEGEFDELIAELALHQLDIVLAGEPAPHNPNLKVSSRLLVSSPVAWCGPAALVSKARVAEFPNCLNQLPVLLPTGHSPLRNALDAWFEQQDLSPRVVAEFEDSALLSVFAARGMGVFPISTLGLEDLQLVRGLRVLAQTDITEDVHAIVTRRSQHHPLVKQIISSS
ncbi:MAG: LysR family transcriptional regulator [Betaproteobacteria bacterium]|nr:LysR family transcriptional regulator [Betaproteobacteria bacterium]NBT10045.1 LysR family transcriptional regulator [Betaproteobacteria bacterium]NBU48843.1 LysR family transcriptional regulator [Betaproteobacteria bacterium]